ncbi:choline transporter [Aspergillus heteromorphus CBS 117.55]|uniref:Choline transporter n=1 Tax=Aspergillus heteromorphus CBS 117.55 TaxID=1448321 RepID=A0A317WRX1_9EURO|nr:choline transporter [Aspergillus heteromorphus CBS 117.55]PWY89149.1 choline transporter [Aspergillus heteromorphus CBS 117.55]
MAADTDRKDAIVSSESIQNDEMEAINLDDPALHASGKPDMPHQFTWASTLGISFSITNSWAGYLSNFGQTLAYGGPRLVIFGFICAFAVQMITILGLSELASAFPSSGGQYHFCYMLSPKKSRRFSAFVVGCMSVLAWWIVTASGISLVTASLTGIVSFWRPEYIAENWHVYLIYLAVSVLTLIPLFTVPNKLHWIVQIALYLSIAGMLLIFILSLALCEKKQPASFLLEDGFGTTGWNDGTAWMLGVMNAMYAIAGTDAAIHISEELPQPGRLVPQAMIMSVLLSLATCLPLFIALMFCMSDMDAVVRSALPSLELIYQATQNRGVTTFLSVWLLIVYAASIPSQWITCSRMAWSLARDISSPTATYFSHVDPTLKFPVRTTLATLTFVAIYGLLYLASTSAFSMITNCAVLFLNITYVVPQGIILISGRSAALPRRYLNLGWLGYVCNGFVVMWIVVLGVFVCLPLSLPVAVESMNYTCVVLVGLWGVVVGLWFGMGKRGFRGPKVEGDLGDLGSG